MVSRIVLNSHPVSYLKQEIAKQNITGYSKLKKPAVVELMLKHKQKFNHIKHNFSSKDKSQQKPTPKPATPKPTTPKPKKKKRIAPTIIQNAPKGSPLKGKGFGTAYDDALARLEKNARAMDQSKKGRKLISNTPVKKSKEPKTKGNYRTGRNYALAKDYAK